MTRTMRVAKGAGALGGLLVLIVGVPISLVVFIGWPLPHALPSWTAMGSDLTSRGIRDAFLLKALACVVWVAWAALSASVAAEVAAFWRGRAARPVPLVAPFQLLACRMVAAATLAFVPTPRSQPNPSPPLAHSLGIRMKPSVLTVDDSVAVGIAPTSAPDNSSVAGTSQTLIPYTVVRYDTLWGIASAHLGDPLRWHEIYDLNAGRPQPDGRSLNEPDRIYPGWTLLLPEPVPAAQPTPVTPSAQPPTPATNPPVSAESRLPNGKRPPSPTPSSPAQRPAGSGAGHGPVVSAPSVLLESGSLVAASFAAGVLSAVSLGRLRRRHTYRPRPPRPGLDLTPPPLGPALRDLQTKRQRDRQDDDAEPQSMPTEVFPPDDGDRIQRPELLEVGVRAGNTIRFDLTEPAGIALVGAGAEDVTRAWVAAMLVRAKPGAAEVIATTDLVERLFPQLIEIAGVRGVPNIDVALRVLEAEAVARTRRLEDAELPDVVAYRRAHPEDPLPTLIALVDTVPSQAAGRWGALLATTRHLGIGAVMLGEEMGSGAILRIAAEGYVEASGPEPLSADFLGADLFRLQPHEATELLGVVAASEPQLSHQEPPLDVFEPYAAQDSIKTATDLPHLTVEPQGQKKWPSSDSSKPIQVYLLGGYRIVAHGEEVTSGLRASAKELLAWYLLRPDGARTEEAIEALWPDVPPERAPQRFWTALGNLRGRLRSEDMAALDVLTKAGERCRPQVDALEVDLWTFQAALSLASRASDGQSRRRALEQAISAYGGEFVDGFDYLWVEPLREELHCKAVDAHLGLAELEEQAGHLETAIQVLERVVQLDRYAEEPYRRLMALQDRIGRHGSVSQTWRLMQGRLAELDLEPEPASLTLYRELTMPTHSVATRPN